MKFEPPSIFSQYKILLSKDLRHEMRTRELLTSMGLYAVLVLVVFGATFTQTSNNLDIQQLSSGLLWTALVFTSLLGLTRSFGIEREAGALDGILLTPIDRSCIYLAKFSANTLFLLLVELVVLPLFYFLFLTEIEISAGFGLALIPILLGTIGMAAVGTLLASITAFARNKEVLLAILFIPVIFPLLYATVSATTAAIVCTTDWELTFRYGIVLSAAYDVIMALASWLLYDYVVGG